MMFKKNYQSIGHLPQSRLGPSDSCISEGQAKIFTEKTRDYKDLIIVQEKVDGANVGVVRHEGRLIGISRTGRPCWDSPLEQFQMFQRFIDKNSSSFSFIDEGERLVGEWLAMAHGTRYKIDNDFPFVAFDLMKGDERLCYLDFRVRVGSSVPVAHLLHIGQPIPVKKALKLLSVKVGDTYGYHGAEETPEGVVYRVEREGKVDFLGKFVQHDKVDGKYFNEDRSNLVWNWKD